MINNALGIIIYPEQNSSNVKKTKHIIQNVNMLALSK